MAKDKTKKHPGGRPTLYKPEYCEMLIKHGETGGSLRAFAAKVGVDEETVHNWKEKHEEFFGAVKRSRDLAYEWFEEQAKLGMWVDKEGPVLNTTLWYMNMKNRFGWRDKHEVEQSGSVKQVHDASELKALLELGEELKKARKK